MHTFIDRRLHMLSVDDVLAARSGKAYDSDGDKMISPNELASFLSA